MIELRDYQKEAVDTGVRYIKNRNTTPGVIVAPCGSGKSLCISSIAKEIEKPTLVIQPSKELLVQNLDKLRKLGGDAQVFSASLMKKDIGHLTYATLGSIKKYYKEFAKVGIDTLLIDECHSGYPPQEDSMFMKFINSLQEELGKKLKVIGFTATPFRVETYNLIQGPHSRLNMINRLKDDSYFKRVIHITQIQDIIDKGFWSPMSYEIWKYDGSTLVLNSTGSEYTEESVLEANRMNNINNNIVVRLLDLINTRRSIMVFMDSVNSCKILVEYLNRKTGREISDYVASGMTAKQRDTAIKKFYSGDTKVMVNYSSLLTGFDHPAIDCIVMGRPTFSLAVMYQAYGRGIRIDPNGVKQDCLVIDCCDNHRRFGKIQELRLVDVKGAGLQLCSGERILTGYPLDSYVTIESVERVHEFNNVEEIQSNMIIPDDKLGEQIVTFGMYKGMMLKELPDTILVHYVKNMARTSKTELLIRYAKFKKLI